tara:strand:+ start:2107 stop:3024 length:918 start_codon:yes stop_codon:yes gene_type:complete
MLFNPNSMAFGRNETFFLKYNWTYKALHAVNQNKDFLSLPNSYLDLGVGKNMLSSIRYWLGAYQILDNDGQAFRDEVAKAIFDPNNGFDPYLEREETLWIMHWRLCSNPTTATLYYWFFNYFKNARFSKEELSGSLNLWLKDNTSRKFASNTLERDINLLLKTYSASIDVSDSIEDSLENPFANLELISKNSDGTYSAEYKHRDQINVHIFTFAVVNLLEVMKSSDLFKKKDVSIIPLSEVIDSQELSSIRNVFRLSENYLIKLVEDMTLEHNRCFGLSETAGQRNLIIKNNSLSLISVIKDIYE